MKSGSVLFRSIPLILVPSLHFWVTSDVSSICRIITIQSSPDKAEKEDEEVATLTREEAASGLSAIGSTSDSGVNLYILAGHEAMQL